MTLELRRPSPRGRTYTQLVNHYLVEKEIAGRLRRATPRERQAIYRTMYDELFRRVPDHPRLTRRASPSLTAAAIRARMAAVGTTVRAGDVFCEFGPGDCRFALAMAAHARHVYAIDISDQRDLLDASPPNFELIVYDGYAVPMPDGVVDVAFSNQLIEHFHPDDTESHFREVRRLLKPGGRYVFLTPHAFSGPHDISRHFADEPQGFHLKEWTYVELHEMARRVGFRRFTGFWHGHGLTVPLPYGYWTMVERVVGTLPSALRRTLGKPLAPSIYAVTTR